MNPKRIIRWILLIAALSGLTWLGWSAYQTARSLQLALHDVDRIQELATSPSLDDFAPLSDDLSALESHLVSARAAAYPFLMVAPHLGWVPHYGPTIVSAPALLSIGVDLAHAGNVGIAIAAPVVSNSAGAEGESLLQVAVRAMESKQVELSEVSDSITHAASLASLIRTPLHPRIQDKVVLLQELLPLAASASQLAVLAPGLLGAEGSRTYLILAQNSHELRATGGFISGAGYIRLQGGKIEEIKITDSYSVDNYQQPHPRPPAALSQQMGTQLWLLRDSNWSPDFPSSATVARALYEQDQGIATDGAIAIDLEAVRLLVEAIGPLSVPGIDQPVTGANVIEQMKIAWTSPAVTDGKAQQTGDSDWWSNRKDFMGELMTAALSKLQSGSSIRPVALGQAAWKMLEGRHLQIAVDDPLTAELLASRGWDGGLRPPSEGDFLAVVDSNVGFNKANAAIRQQIRYEVESDETGHIAVVTIRYEHTAEAFPESQLCNRNPRYGDSYDELIRRCYWDYLRVYAPGGSELLESSGLDRVSTDVAERNTTLFSGDFVLRPGNSTTITLRYRLPESAISDPYRITVRTQGGTVSLPLEVQYGSCLWNTTLDRDVSLQCSESGS